MECQKLFGIQWRDVAILPPCRPHDGAHTWCLAVSSSWGVKRDALNCIPTGRSPAPCDTAIERKEQVQKQVPASLDHQRKRGDAYWCS